MGVVRTTWERARAFLGWQGPAAGTAPAMMTFSATSGPIDALVSGMLGAWGNTGWIGRDDALSVAAIKRGRDQICSIATLPLANFRGIDQVPSTFLTTLDPDVPRVVMLAQTVEDLLCDGVSWWRKLGLDYRGYPIAARRLEPSSVSLDPPPGITPAPLPSGLDPRDALVWVDGIPTRASELIRFDSPNGPLLRHGARTIRRAIVLDMLAGMYARNPRPLDYFTDGDDMSVRAYTPAEIDVFLAEWRHNRSRSGTAYIPKALMRADVNAPSPAELQLVELQKQVTLELANLLGIDPEEVGVSTTSRTYFNAIDRRTGKINETFAPYMSAITDRLSMGDVTPLGQAAKWDLTDYLKPDPATQVVYWKGLFDMGAIDSADVRGFAGIPGPPPAAAPAPALPAGAGENQRRPPLQLGDITPAHAFAGGPAMVFNARDFATPPAAPTVDTAKRTVTGLAVPYNARAVKYGVGFRFKPGSLEYDADQLSRVKVLQDHTTPVGVHSGITDSADGPTVALSIFDGVAGSPEKMQRDQLLYDAEHGLYDGLSVGVDFDLSSSDVKWNESDQTYDVYRATWNETSLTPMPAFTGARVTSVAASRTGGSMNCQFCGHPHGPGISCQTYMQLMGQQAAAGQPAALALSATPAAPAAPAATGPVAAAVLPAGPMSAADLTAALQQFTAAAVANGQVAPAAPLATTVDPTTFALPGQAAAARAKVIEPDPYRLSFDRKGFGIMARGSHDFSQDFHAYFADGDLAAGERALSFVQRKMAAMFNVATTDVDETNPTRQRPDMYVDQRNYRTPLWDAINKGTLADITPFTFPKFNSASGLVAAHTQGTEPTGGTFTTTGQTVTPTAYSGKAVINREVWDQGGNPQISTLIWNQMVKGVNEALEAAAVTLLNAGTYAALNTFTAGAVDRNAAGNTLGDQLEAGIAALQFARGGYAFTDAFAQADLYLTLAATKASDGRPRYPQIGPANANGTTGEKFSEIDIAGQAFYPEWALAAAGQTAATKSYLIDRTSVAGWATAPQRLTMDQVNVATVGLGVWGYQATAVSDDNGVRTITWDPVA